MNKSLGQFQGLRILSMMSEDVEKSIHSPFPPKSAHSFCLYHPALFVPLGRILSLTSGKMACCLIIVVPHDCGGNLTVSIASPDSVGVLSCNIASCCAPHLRFEDLNDMTVSCSTGDVRLMSHQVPGAGEYHKPRGNVVLRLIQHRESKTAGRLEIALFSADSSCRLPYRG